MAAMETTGLRIYRVINRYGQGWAWVQASSPEEACRKAGWPREDCSVREVHPITVRTGRKDHDHRAQAGAEM